MLCKELLQAHSQVHSNAPLLPRSTRSRRPLLWWVSDEEDADTPPTPTVWASNCSQLYFFKISSCTFRISSCTAGYPASRVPNNSFTGRPFCTPRVGMGRCLQKNKKLYFFEQERGGKKKKYNNNTTTTQERNKTRKREQTLAVSLPTNTKKGQRETEKGQRETKTHLLRTTLRTPRVSSKTEAISCSHCAHSRCHTLLRTRATKRHLFFGRKGKKKN